MTSTTEPTPSDEELAALIKPLWLAAKPSPEAQAIRAELSVAVDDGKFPQWVLDYVWDLVDIAAQRGINNRSDAMHVCGEAYQAAVLLANMAGVFDDPSVQALLDNLSDAADGKPLSHETVLPFYPAGWQSKYQEAGVCPVCGGDCAGANPPVIDCPMRRASITDE